MPRPSIPRPAMLLLAPLLLAAAPPPEPSFCARLAPKLGMKLATQRGAPSQPAEWKVNTLGGLGPALFGGSSVMSFGAESVGDAEYSPALAERISATCEATAKGARCAPTGPTRIVVGTKKGKVFEDTLPDERPVLEIRGTSIHCRDS